MACSTGCSTGPHATYGECLRAKGIQVADVKAHQFNTNRDSEINNYIDARKSGMQPETIFKKDVDFARDYTERTGTPYRADLPAAPIRFAKGD